MGVKVRLEIWTGEENGWMVVMIEGAKMLPNMLVVMVMKLP